MTSRWRAVLAGGLAVTLAGCQQDGTGTAPVTGSQPVAVAARSAPPGFECPRPGTQVFFGSNVRTYRGTDPADPFVCLYTFQGPNGPQQGRMLGNFVFMPTSDDAAIRRGLFDLWPLTPGKRITYTHDARTNDGANFRMRQDARVIGQRRMQIAGTDRDVIVIENDQQNANWTGYFVTWTHYYDIESRTIIGGDIAIVRGSDRRSNWRATNVFVPR